MGPKRSAPKRQRLNVTYPSIAKYHFQYLSTPCDNQIKVCKQKSQLTYIPGYNGFLNPKPEFGKKLRGWNPYTG